MYNNKLMFLKLQTQPSFVQTVETTQPVLTQPVLTQPMIQPMIQPVPMMETKVSDLRFAAEQAAGLYVNNMIKENEIKQVEEKNKIKNLATSCWLNIKDNLDDLKNVIKLVNIDHDIYPHLELCNNLESMVFSDDFNATINLSKLDNLKEVTFGSYFNHVISKDNLPQNLKKLTLGLNFIRKIDSLPNSIEELYIDNRYNSPIYLPSNLLVLSFGDSFNQELLLPSSLEQLSFGYHFNKTIKLPKSLKVFNMSTKFNQDIVLNEKLEELTVGNQFNRNLKLPESMKILNLKNKTILPKITLNSNVVIVE